MRGRARLGKRTKELVARLEHGEIAVVDHEDLDEVAARGLVDAKPAAVINARPSMSGRYPNPGPGSSSRPEFPSSIASEGRFSRARRR